MGKSLKGRELGKGITQRKDGLYQARFTNRFGKRKTIYAKTMSEITKRLREEQYLDDKKLNPVNDSMTLDEWFEQWITTCKIHCRDTTKRTYRIQYNRLREDLGWRPLSSLNLVILQDAFNHLKSDASRRDCRAVLVDMLNRAVECDMLMKNVAYGVKTTVDDEEPTEKRILSDDEIDILINTADPRGTLKIFLIVALETGMRMGEILGLTWDCIDFRERMIKVEKTLCYLPNNGEAIYEFHKPKTTAGKRSIPMTEKCRQALLYQKNWKSHVMVRHNPKTGFENLVFCSKSNNPIHEANIRGAIHYLVDKINRENPDIEFEPFTPHGLRHTFATKAIKRGMKPKTLQKILGHSSLQMTMDLYCHVEDDTLKSEMLLFEKAV
ncbi:site-specific integrase [Eubacterium sp. MSJ-33]|uniref:site-specific integrase n=1 Tax=Eubacterium sp. MSJ-33 TaxID=2841528 RepID=UPI001C77EA87|nr:site-specific integrase [Eubacterium sp. MSJ-33]QWT53041.1 site-specific integrase [Eubacterium sp. MSJ-33]